MIFKIETEAKTGPDFRFGAIEHDEASQIDLTNFVRAERLKRQVVAAIWGVDSEQELTDYINSQSMMLDALFLAHPDLSEEIDEQEEECRVGLRSATASNSDLSDAVPAEPGNSLGIKF